ncbi:HD domain-containing protein [Clostridium sp. D2Q-14]|uniref:HD domain-containing protein n=1 Tax=Anaeromonas gelatinilytica TaxID=2683194 RepID=UPI00193B3967|nr:HD domain-containing protein [Anaeromonas gelatinilytica]MBS4535923.1 HD domain-containing protein [Anaeromonas gelatinilytica]
MDTIFSILQDISKEENVNIYVTGKYLRDFLLGKKVKDMELLVSNKTFSIAKKFADKIDMQIIEGNNSLGYRVIDIDRDLRIDFYSIEEDNINIYLQKRGITIDSMAVDICNFQDELKGNIIDPTGGLKDIENSIIRIWDEDVIYDNPLLIIKSVALMSELNFDMDRDTITVIKKNKSLVSNIQCKELGEEFFKVLRRRKTYHYFSFMNDELEILEEIFPEIKKMKEVGECDYHVVDAFRHSLYVLKLTEDVIYYDGYFEDHIRKSYENHAEENFEGDHTRIELMKLAAFFHDVGKPSARKIDSTGRVRFKGHEITGAEMVKDISKRFGLSIKARDILYRIVAKHMLPLVSYKSNDVSARFLYKMFQECKDETLDVLLIALADIIGTRKLLNPDEEMGKFKIHVEYIANNYITRYKEIEDLSDVINGKDIIQEFDLPDGVLVSDLIEEVRKAIFMGKIGMNKNSILKYLQNIL